MIQQEVCVAYPPMYEEIQAEFGLKRDAAVIFSWGSIIYNPMGMELNGALLAHEAVHGQRQGDTATSIVDWWTKYLDDDLFRLREEIPAHVAEYLWWVNNGNRRERRSARDRIARKLADPLYKYGHRMGVAEAKRALHSNVSRRMTDG